MVPVHTGQRGVRPDTPNVVKQAVRQAGFLAKLLAVPNLALSDFVKITDVLLPRKTDFVWPMKPLARTPPHS